MAYKVSVYSFTKNGNELADKICSININSFRCEKLIFCKEDDNTIDEIKFSNSSAHVFIGATGIVIRKIAKYVDSKLSDPAVIVVDEKGKNVIPILSGHVGGGNALARIIAGEINANPVITTATDVNGYRAIDEIVSEARLIMSPIDSARIVNSKILNGETVKVYIDKAIDIEVIEDKTGVYEISDLESSDVAITSSGKYVVGVGCRKNIDSDVFDKTLNDTLFEYGIRTIDIDRISSIDLKACERAILEYTEKNNILFETYSKEELLSVEGEFDESDFVKEITGVSNVSERAATYACLLIGSGEFVLKRKAENGITISIMKVRKRIDLNGRA